MDIYKSFRDVTFKASELFRADSFQCLVCSFLQLKESLRWKGRETDGSDGENGSSASIWWSPLVWAHASAVSLTMWPQSCSCDTPSNNWWKKGAWWKLMIFISDTLHPISWGKWIFCKYMVVTPSLGACCSIPDYVATIPTCSCDTPSNNWWKKGTWDLIK